MNSREARTSFEKAEAKAAEAVELLARPIGLGASHSIEHQSVQAMAEAMRDLARGLQALTPEA